MKMNRFNLVVWMLIAVPQLILGQQSRVVNRNQVPDRCPKVLSRSPSPGCYLVPVRDPLTSCIVDYTERCPAVSSVVGNQPFALSDFSHNSGANQLFPQETPLFPESNPLNEQKSFRPSDPRASHSRIPSGGVALARARSKRPERPRQLRTSLATQPPVVFQTQQPLLPINGRNQFSERSIQSSSESKEREIVDEGRQGIPRFQSLRPDDPNISSQEQLDSRQLFGSNRPLGFGRSENTGGVGQRVGAEQRAVSQDFRCPLITPPQPQPGCYWIPIIGPRSQCLVHYGTICRPVNVRCPRITRPPARRGCVWVSIHHFDGCISTFRCRPKSCSQNEEPPTRNGCTWFPVRDQNGCTTTHQCLSVEAEPKKVRCPVPEKPETLDCDLIPISDPDGCILRFKCTEEIPAPVPSTQPPQPLVRFCPPVPQPKPSPGCRNVPVKDHGTGCLIKYRSQCQKLLEPVCPQVNPPVYTDNCNLVSIHDQTGCVVEFECEPIHCPPLTPPVHKKGCTWVPKRNADGCTTAFKCTKVKKEAEKCPNEPQKPDTTGICTWIPVKNEEGCITDYKCNISEEKRTRIGITLPPPERNSRKFVPNQQPFEPPVVSDTDSKESARRDRSKSSAQQSRHPLSIGLNPDFTDNSGVFPTFESIFGSNIPESPRLIPDGCPNPPPAPDSGGFCRWIPLTDQRGCIVNYECERAQNNQGRNPFAPPVDFRGASEGFQPNVGFIRPNAQPVFPDDTFESKSCPPEPVRPRDTSYCRWEPQNDDNQCIIRYKCRRIKPSVECPEPPARPDGSPGCIWSPVADRKGCVIDFQCEPGGRVLSLPETPKCRNEPRKPSETRRCRYVPLRDTRGCITNYKCDRKLATTTTARPTRRPSRILRLNRRTEAPLTEPPQLPTLPATRRPQRPQVEVVDLNPPNIRRPISGPFKSIGINRQAISPNTTPSPYLRRRECPAEPILPSGSLGCNWIEIYDQQRCLISYRCEPKYGIGRGPAGTIAPESLASQIQPAQGPSNLDCRNEPVSPPNSDRCLWVGIKDSRGCVIDFECEPVPPKTTTRTPCPKKPKRPKETSKCSWKAIRKDGCLVNYECQTRCEDRASRCPLWAQSGMCFQHARFMLQTCPSACGIC